MSEEALRQARIALAFNSQPSRCSEFAHMITSIIDRLEVTELLDYGCGSGELVAHLKPNHPITIQRYDPAKEEFAGEPEPMQMVVCIDVLDCVENEYLEKVIQHLVFLTGSVLFIVIGKSEKSPQEWFSLLSNHFDVRNYQKITDLDTCIIAYPKMKPLIETEHGN